MSADTIQCLVAIVFFAASIVCVVASAPVGATRDEAWTELALLGCGFVLLLIGWAFFEAGLS